MEQAPGSYLLAGQQSELDRLQLQSKVWEPAASAVLDRLPASEGLRALDAGCGVLGWLRVLSHWVGPTGSVVGTDIDDRMLAHAQHLVDTEGLANVQLTRDDLFASVLPPRSFDLVHARFQIAPLGRASEQLAAYVRLLRPGGTLVLEEPDAGSWRVNPEAPATQRLIALIEQSFLAAGGDFNAGRTLPALLNRVHIEAHTAAHVVALEPGHPYLRLPLQFAASLRPRLERLLPGRELDDLVAETERELDRPGTWGTTFTLVQAFGASPRSDGSVAPA